MGFSNEIFRHSETKICRRNLVIPPIKHKFFRYPNFSENLKGCPRSFSSLWDKKFSTENCDTHIMHKIVRFTEISETLKGCPPNFSALWDQNFPTGKRDTPVFIHKIFWNRNFSQKQWDSRTKVFGTVRQKFRRKNVIPLIRINFFDTPKLRKHWRLAHDFFRHCETKIIRRRNVIPPSMQKGFRYPHFSETLKGCPRKFSALWDKNFLTEKCDTPY